MALLKKKPKPKSKAKPPAKLPTLGELPYEEQVALAPGAPVLPGQSWADLINADPILIGDLGNIEADEVSDKASTMAALKAALIRMGGAGLAGIVGKLGPEWAELLDPATVAAAQAGDQGGVSVASQLAKAHKDSLLAQEDVRAARGILSSGQSGYEIGEERQRNTIANNDALNSLLSALQGGIGDFAGRQRDRLTARSTARGTAADRLISAGLTPAPPQVQAPPTAPALVQQLRRNAKRPIRRPIRGYE